jgi:hypothetical protein
LPWSRQSRARLIAGAKFPGLCLLLARNRERTLEIRFRFRRLRRLERHFTSNAIDLSLEPLFLGCSYDRHRFADAPPGVIEFTEFGMSTRHVTFFGLVELPKLLQTKVPGWDWTGDLHSLLANYALLALIGAHVTAALSII